MNQATDIKMTNVETKDSESTAEIHFILDYLPRQTNLRVLKMNKRGKNKGEGSRGKIEMQRRQETDGQSQRD